MAQVAAKRLVALQGSITLEGRAAFNRAASATNCGLLADVLAARGSPYRSDQLNIYSIANHPPRTGRAGGCALAPVRRALTTSATKRSMRHNDRYIGHPISAGFQLIVERRSCAPSRVLPSGSR